MDEGRRPGYKEAMNKPISPSSFRNRLGQILDRVHFRQERFVIERRGTPLAAVIPIETLESMEHLSRTFMLGVLGRRKTHAEDDALADEAKHQSRRRRSDA